jgi:hypothetical protein
VAVFGHPLHGANRPPSWALIRTSPSAQHRSHSLRIPFPHKAIQGQAGRSARWAPPAHSRPGDSRNGRRLADGKPTIAREGIEQIAHGEDLAERPAPRTRQRRIRTIHRHHHSLATWPRMGPAGGFSPAGRACSASPWRLVVKPLFPGLTMRSAVLGPGPSIGSMSAANVRYVLPRRGIECWALRSSSL